MSMPIFKKGTCRKDQLFDTFISLVRAGGWTVTEKNGTPDSFFLSSNGLDGTSKMTAMIRPYDGTFTASYDMRYTVAGSNAVFNLIKDYNPVDHTYRNYNTPPVGIMLPFNGNRTDSVTTAQNIRTDYLFDYYYYIDADIVIFISHPFDYVGLLPSLFMFGKSSEILMKEKNTKEYSGMFYAASNAAYASGPYFMDTCASGVMENGSSVLGKTFEIKPPLPKDLDGNYGLYDFYVGVPAEGIRGKVSYFYMMTPGNILSGDIIEVNKGASIERYKVITVGFNGNYSSVSIPSNQVAIRIE